AELPDHEVAHGPRQPRNRGPRRRPGNVARTERTSQAASQTRMARKSLTLTCVGPVTTRSPRASKTRLELLLASAFAGSIFFFRAFSRVSGPMIAPALL